MFEPGDRALPIRSTAVNDWAEAKAYLQLLEGESPEHETIVVDVVDVAYDMCMKYVCDKLVIDYPRDDDYGASWKAVRREWEGWMRRLLAIPGKAPVFLSHARFNSITRRDGTKIDILGPTTGGAAMGVVEGLVDTIAYYGYNGSKRVLVIRGDEHIDAGTRLDVQFLTKSGKQVRAIDMGGSKEDAYMAFLKAFSNRGTTIGEMPLVKPPERSKKKRR